MAVWVGRRGLAGLRLIKRHHLGVRPDARRMEIHFARGEIEIEIDDADDDALAGIAERIGIRGMDLVERAHPVVFRRAERIGGRRTRRIRIGIGIGIGRRRLNDTAAAATPAPGAAKDTQSHRDDAKRRSQVSI